MAKDHISVKKMWEGYLDTIGESIETTDKDYTSWHFEITEKSANNLADLVLSGQKKATAASLWVEKHDHGDIPKVGDFSIITNWDGLAKCIIQTTSIDIVPYNQVTEAFVKVEGEGDQSLEYWRQVHEDYYRKECHRIGKEFNESMPVICEIFEVVFQ